MDLKGMKGMKKILGIILIAIGILTAIFGLILKVKGQVSVSIIGGEDGPTSIFFAGKVGGMGAVIGILVGIMLLAVGVVMIARKK